MNIWFASGNIHKKAELAAILANAIFASAIHGEAIPEGQGCTILIPQDAGLHFDPEETGSSFRENALLKAGELYSLLTKHRPPLFVPGDPIIADDSGICVDALDGRPGIFSARYAGPGADAAQRNTLLLEELGDSPRRSARFVCAMALLFSPDRFFLAQETLEGEIVNSPEAARGSGGFGYDPILFIPELNRTVAELSEEEKNTISHRAKAGKNIAAILRSVCL